MSEDNNLTIVPPDKQTEVFKAAFSRLFPSEIPAEGVVFQNPMEVRALIEDLQAELLKLEDSLIQCETSHSFANGMYMRTIFIPKGSLVIGKIHRHECLSVMSMGDKITLTEEGVRRLKPPFMAVSRPGLKRVGFAIEDSVWTTIHRTNETDLEKLDSELFTENYSDAAPVVSGPETKITLEGKSCQHS